MSKVKERSGNVEQTAEKMDTFFNPHPTGGGGVRDRNLKKNKHQVLKSISGMQLYPERSHCKYSARSRVIRGREGRTGGREWVHNREPEQSRVTR